MDKCIGSRIHIVMKSDKEIVGTLLGFDDFVSILFPEKFYNCGILSVFMFCRQPFKIVFFPKKDVACGIRLNLQSGFYHGDGLFRTRFE